MATATEPAAPILTSTFTMKVPIRRNEDGTLLVEGTRVPIDTVISVFKLGNSPKGIARKFSTLKLADIYAVISYYLQNQVAVDEYLRQREEYAAKLQAKVEARCNPEGIRDRLLARRHQKEQG
jgi:uncharacterized protein (DUF433 family)